MSHAGHTLQERHREIFSDLLRPSFFAEQLAMEPTTHHTFCLTGMLAPNNNHHLAWGLGWLPCDLKLLRDMFILESFLEAACKAI
eukprot:4979205-Amphidinium_carterae.1